MKNRHWTAGFLRTIVHELDSWFIPTGEVRALLNKGILPATLITIIQKP